MHRGNVNDEEMVDRNRLVFASNAGHSMRFVRPDVMWQQDRLLGPVRHGEMLRVAPMAWHLITLHSCCLQVLYHCEAMPHITYADTISSVSSTKNLVGGPCGVS